MVARKHEMKQVRYHLFSQDFFDTFDFVSIWILTTFLLIIFMYRLHFFYSTESPTAEQWTFRMLT